MVREACGITTVDSYTQASITLSFPAAGLSLIESYSDIVEKNQSMTGRGTMDIFSGRAFKVDVATCLVKQILCTENNVFAYRSRALDYIVRPLG